ncbi:MAG: T9SS type A sorting domain-containing protein [Candidatus Electryonea clarkiae]|nr:T9SS type A sorting domain-containing protein [Candidatus Electryonea clarkiae]MDP8287114.1 T9SS type A sorting domain-containing protein [Candidatus Electryonea clarkiae]
MFRRGCIQIFCLTLLILVLTSNLIYATPYIPPEELQYQFEHRTPFTGQQDRGEIPGPGGELDEYYYTLEVIDILDWLTNMQVSIDGNDFGGMREGESNRDWEIIQTDNTQEALRDWAHYASMTGDPDHYSNYIDAAWEYIMNYPAYSEEGGGNPNYYRVHNCGWGLVAVMEYTNAYEDSTYIEYGDSCAAYLNEYRLDIDDYVVNPLSAGFGAGCLYLYGVWRESQEWIDAAQEIADEVRLWIEDDPDHLNDYENWAMSGGTAMWGVVTALYIDDPEAGADWIPDYMDDMDVYSGPGQWNNSWTVWYGHAWNAIHRVLDDDESFENVLEVADFLLDQDGFDGDGGIPATEDQYLNDQSWTSAYLVWYCLESILENDIPAYDAALINIVSPNPNIPLMENNPVPLTLEVANVGLNSLENVIVSLRTDRYDGSTNANINFGDREEVTLEPDWIPGSPGEYILDFIVEHPDDANTSNDTLSVTLNVLPAATISGEITDSYTDEDIHSWIDYYLLEVSSDIPFYAGECLPNSGEFSQDVVTGTYRLEITPLLPPYTPRTIDSLIVDEDGANDVNLSISPALVMLVAEDPAGYEEYFLSELSNLNIDTYTWHTFSRGYPEDTLTSVPCVIWSTGDLEEGFFPADNWTDINLYLESGGSMLLTGQGIQDLWGGYTILRSRFGVDDGELGIAGVQNRILRSTPEAPITEGDSLALLGAAGEGANNQETPDEVVPVNNSSPILYYGEDTELTAAVAFEHPQEHYRTVFCGFGIEGINNSNDRYISREEFLRRTLTWFGVNEAGDDPRTKELPNDISLDLWPNPFNSTLNIQISLPNPENVEVALYNIIGQEISRLTPMTLSSGQNRLTFSDLQLSSGLYFVKIITPSYVKTERIVLLK